MGFSTSAAVVVFAASIMYMASIFYPVTNMSYNRFLEAKKSLNDIQYEKLNTRIAITSTQLIGSDLNVTVYNNGSSTLNSSKLNVIYNGSLRSFIVSKSGVWVPRSSINLTISNGAANSRIKVISANGASDYAIT